MLLRPLALSPLAFTQNTNDKSRRRRRRRSLHICSNHSKCWTSKQETIEIVDKSKDSKQIDKKQSYLGPTRWCQAKSWKEAIDCKFLSAIQFPGILIVNLRCNGRHQQHWLMVVVVMWMMMVDKMTMILRSHEKTFPWNAWEQKAFLKWIRQYTDPHNWGLICVISMESWNYFREFPFPKDVSLGGISSRILQGEFAIFSNEQRTILGDARASKSERMCKSL